MVSYWQFTTTDVYKLFFNFHNILQTDYIGFMDSGKSISWQRGQQFIHIHPR